MIKVKVRLFAALKEFVGSSEIEIVVPEEASVGSLLEKLAQDYGEDFYKHIIDERTESVRNYLKILVDGKYVSFSEMQSKRLWDGATVTILPPIGGGYTLKPRINPTIRTRALDKPRIRSRT